MASRSRSDLEAALAAEEARLAAIDRERADVRSRIERLRLELVGAEGCSDEHQMPPPAVASQASIMPALAKVALFRSLFRGRGDVYPKLWQNSRTGRQGYAPACANEWVRPLCDKPRVKCGECTNQAFLPVTDEAILNHLRRGDVTKGDVMGVYPMLRDETCWFLAVDFDKGAWGDDVGAFAETASARGMSVAIERSRSGNGAHAWFFFAEPVPAAIARRMGCHLITETMARRHELGMESYDRLFPNQDTMPKGGFGNLIALPLQYEARQRGNTLFLDDRLVPFEDQWSYLASIERIPAARVEEIAAEALRKGQVIGVRSADAGDEDAEQRAPWNRRSSPGARKLLRIAEPLPRVVRAVVAQRVFVEKAGLPSVLLNQIKRLAAFQNPEFYKKQGLRLSTALTPRVISCAEEFPEHIALPRGCVDELETLLGNHDVALQIDDQRTSGSPLNVRFDGRLTDAQVAAVQALRDHDCGVFVAPPGVGKTVVGVYLLAERARSTLVLVHRQQLLDQWVAQLSRFLGIDKREIGKIGGGGRKPNGRLDVAMLQSLVQGNATDELASRYGHVIVDECHHVPAVSFERVLSALKPRFVTGLTATPRRRDGHHPIIEMQIGPVRFAIEPKSEAARRPFEHRLIVRETPFRFERDSSTAAIQDLYRELVADARRNELIINDVIAALEEKRSPIVLTERKDHLELLAEQLRPATRNLVILKGGMGARQRRQVAEQIAAIPSNEERLVLATGRYIGEGFDDARLDTLFLALPVSWKGTLVQYAGRLNRLDEGKRDVRIFDYVDRGVPMLARMFEKRLRGYHSIGYEQTNLPDGYGGSSDETVVELDGLALPESIRAQ
jgi:superfamily II DNA or RNA helicase